jgi:hypothetical protein
MDGSSESVPKSAEPASRGGGPAVPDATVISGRPADAGRQTSVTEIGRSLEGHWLGPYRLDKFVGGGGMGAVFRALDTTLDRVVAVKVLSRQQSGDEEMLRRFRNEAQSAARLDHENIGRVHAVGSDDGWHYIVFEFIEGTNLRDVVQQEGPFGIARTIDVTIQVAEALEHASRRNVVHTPSAARSSSCSSAGPPSPRARWCRSCWRINRIRRLRSSRCGPTCPDGSPPS